MQQLTPDQLKSFLWEAANILRGKIDSSDYKHYILGLLFYKRLSDNFKEDYDQQVKDLGEAVASNPDIYQGSRFYIPEGSRWQDIRNTSVNIGEKINAVFAEVTRANTPRLDGLLDKIDFNDSARLSNEVVNSLVNHFSAQNLGSSVVSGDILGDAYEYMIAQFADDAGKKGGEFYTPVKIVELLVKVLDPQENESIHDPAVGSGGILVTAGRVLKEKGYDPTKLQMSGQENIYNTFILARMNMILHGYTDARIRKGDTFTQPQFTRKDGGLEQFDMVLANPPWNLKSWMHKATTVTDKNGKAKKKVVEIEDPYNRIKYGRPPASSADWAWIQHMYASLKPRGRMGIVMDNGVLFRGSKEKAARKAFVEMDVIDTIVGLPSNLFANTGSPGCLVFISKRKQEERKGKILFIDASKDYQEGKAQNHLREEDVQKTLDTYHTYESIERYCTVADLEEIQENDFNLNISRYVDTTEPEEEVDIPEVLRALDKLEKEKAEIDQRLKGYLKELGW